MKRSAIGLLLLLAALLPGCGEGVSSPSAGAAGSAAVNLAAETARARAEHKLLVLEFTGSDWCPSCVYMHKHVLTQPPFTTYAQSNLVFIELDYPRRTDPPPAVKATNDLLAAQFDISMFPTFIALDRDGKEIWRLPAKDDPNPKVVTDPGEFVGLLEAVRKKLE